MRIVGWVETQRNPIALIHILMNLDIARMFVAKFDRRLD
jgi:hypothetical protein